MAGEKTTTKKAASKKAAAKKTTAKKTTAKKARTGKMDITKKLDLRRLATTIQKKARKIRDTDIRQLVQRGDQIERKFKSIPEKLGKLVPQVRLLFEMVKDYWSGQYREVPWYSISVAAATLLYFLSPVDLIPDFIPGIGYLDDVAVVLLCFKAIQGDLKAYCRFKQYHYEEYF